MNRQQRRNRQRHTASDPFSAPTLRRSCSECGAPVDWLANDQVQDLIGDRLPEFLSFMPADVGLVALVRGDFWRCRRSACGEFGVVLPAGVM